MTTPNNYFASPMKEDLRSAGAVKKGGGTKGKRDRKNANKPRKKPLSAYNIFFRRERERVLEVGGPAAFLQQWEADKDGGPKEKIEDLDKMSTFRGLATVIAARWKSMEPSEKEPYEVLAAEDLLEEESATATSMAKISYHCKAMVPPAAPPTRTSCAASSSSYSSSLWPTEEEQQEQQALTQCTLDKKQIHHNVRTSTFPSEKEESLLSSVADVANLRRQLDEEQYRATAVFLQEPAQQQQEWAHQTAPSLPRTVLPTFSSFSAAARRMVPPPIAVALPRNALLTTGATTERSSRCLPSLPPAYGRSCGVFQTAAGVAAMPPQEPTSFLLTQKTQIPSNDPLRAPRNATWTDQDVTADFAQHNDDITCLRLLLQLQQQQNHEDEDLLSKNILCLRGLMTDATIAAVRNCSGDKNHKVPSSPIETPHDPSADTCVLQGSMLRDVLGPCNDNRNNEISGMLSVPSLLRRHTSFFPSTGMASSCSPTEEQRYFAALHSSVSTQMALFESHEVNYSAFHVLAAAMAQASRERGTAQPW